MANVIFKTTGCELNIIILKHRMPVKGRKVIEIYLNCWRYVLNWALFSDFLQQRIFLLIFFYIILIFKLGVAYRTAIRAQLFRRNPLQSFEWFLSHHMLSQIFIAPKKVGLLLYYKNILFNYYILKVLISNNMRWMRRLRHRYQKPTILRLPCKLIWSVLWCLEFDLLICQVDA